MAMDFYEEIKRNTYKTVLLGFAFLGILLSVGLLLDLFFDTFPLSTVIFTTLAAINLLVAFFVGHKLILRSLQARPLRKDKFEEKQLSNILEELSIANGLSTPPDLYIIENDASVNAFATGYSTKKGVICVTSGLTNILNREEIQAVLAHELAHLLNRDTTLMTVLTSLLGTLIMLRVIMGRSLWYSAIFGSPRRYRGSRGGRKGGQAIILYIVVFFLLTILAAILARLLVLAISRTREYLADATAVQMVRNPAGLASALRKIGRAHHPLKSANMATAHLFIADPLCRAINEREGFFANLASTHPPLHKRIARLENKEPAEILSSLYHP